MHSKAKRHHFRIRIDIICVYVYIYNIVVSVTYFIYHTTRRPSFLGQLQTTPMRGKRLLGTEMKEIGFACKTGCVWAQVSPKKHSKFSLEKRFSHRLEWGSPLSNPQHVGGLSQWYPMNSRVNSMYPHTRFPRLANGSGIRLPTGSLADGILVWNWKKHGVQGIFQDCWMTSSDSAGNLNDSNRD